jgi:hypothetical protein
LTIDERIDRLEHVTAAHIEQAKKDYEENRRLWREQQTDIAAIWHRMEERDKQFDAFRREHQQQQTERDRVYKQEQKERDQKIDQRIGDLVTAIGELCRRLDAKPSH